LICSKTAEELREEEIACANVVIIYHFVDEEVLWKDTWCTR
jgi:hypothetical protein